MNRILHNAPWVISVGVLLFLAGFFYFAVRGYSYIGHTLILICFLILMHRFAPDGLWRLTVILVCIGLIYFCIVELPIVKNSRTDEDAGRKYGVVLGAQVLGDRPSRSLLYRLNGALEFLWFNPESVVIVSGGQGEGEDITEAQCMFEWLVDKGVEPERIIMEHRATSTMENLEYSFEIIRQLGDEPDGNVTILSSNYHLYRAKEMARMQGVDAAGFACSPGNPILALNYFICEAFGVTHLWIFGD